MTGKARRTLALYLVVLAFGLTSSWARANVILLGEPRGKPGDEIELSIAVTPGTTLSDIDIVPNYEDFAAVVTFLGLAATDALTQGGSGLCINGMCTYFYIPNKSFAQQTILATLHFRVTDDAESFVDSNGQFPFDLGVRVTEQKVALPQGLAFTVLEIPEPSTYALMVAGVFVLVAVRIRLGQTAIDEPLLIGSAAT